MQKASLTVAECLREPCRDCLKTRFPVIYPEINRRVLR